MTELFDLRKRLYFLSAAVMGWPLWPVQLVSLAVLVVNARLAWRLKQFANNHSEQYLVARA